MDFQIASDLHIENDEDTPSTLSLIQPNARILILAGDIGRIHKLEQLESFLKDVCKHFKYVLYVLGNNEFYKVKNKPEKTYEELYSDIKGVEERIENLYILNRSIVVIKNICFAGCTLWSEFTGKYIPPYIVRIPGMDKKKYNGFYKEDLSFVNNAINYASTNQYKLVMITHHPPSYTLLSTERKKDKFVSLYASNLDYLLCAEKVKVWISGHIHRNFDITSVFGTRLVANQRGKPKDKITDYKKSKIVSV